MPPRDPVELLQGTLDLMILRGLAWGPHHGYAVARWIQRVTDDVLRVDEGSLYPALHRLEERGLVESEWGPSEHNRRAKYYTLTPAGRQRLRAQTSSWERFAAAVFKVLTTTEQPA